MKVAAPLKEIIIRSHDYLIVAPCFTSHQFSSARRVNVKFQLNLQPPLYNSKYTIQTRSYSSQSPPPAMQRELFFTVGCKVGVCCYHPLWLDGTQPDRCLPFNPGTGWAGAQNCDPLEPKWPTRVTLTSYSCLMSLPHECDYETRSYSSQSPPPAMQRELFFTVGCKVGVCCYHPLWLDGTQPDRCLPFANSANNPKLSHLRSGYADEVLSESDEDPEADELLCLLCSGKHFRQ